MALPLKPIKLKAGAPVKTPAKVQPAKASVKETQKSEAISEDEALDLLFDEQPAAPSQEETTEEAEEKEQPEKGKSKSSKKKVAKKSEKKEEAEFTGPRPVKVYGQVLFTENDPKVSLDQIRERIVSEFGYDEFSAGRTTMSFDEKTGIVVPQISFQKKG